MKLFLENKENGRRYQIIRFDKETNEVVLQGQYAQFREPSDKERFQRLGYEIVREEDSDHAVQP